MDTSPVEQRSIEQSKDKNVVVSQETSTDKASSVQLTDISAVKPFRVPNTVNIQDIRHAARAPLGITQTGFAHVLEMAEKSRLSPSKSIINWTTKIRNFYNVVRMNIGRRSATEGLVIDDHTGEYSAVRYLSYALSTYHDLPHTALLGIRFNDPLYPFTIDPTKPEIISDVAPKYHDIMSSSIRIPGTGEGSIITTDCSIMGLVSSLVYILCGSINSYGNHFYITKTGLESADPTMDALLSNQYITAIGDVSGQSETDGEILCGRLEATSKLVGPLTGTTGFIPTIDPEYQHNLPLLAVSYRNEAIRAKFRDAFPAPRPFGTISSTATVIEGKKISETMILNSDLIVAQTHARYLKWLRENNVNTTDYVALLNSMIPQRDDYANNQDAVFYQFLSIRPVQIGNDYDIDVMTFFPGSANFISCFEYGMKVPTVLAEQFTYVYDFVRDHLSVIPFLSVEESMSDFQSSGATSASPNLGQQLSLMSVMLDITSPELISQYVACDLMSHVINIRASVTEYRNNTGKVPFTLDLLGLCVEKHMFYNLWLRNKAQWYYKVYNFLQAYLGHEYNPVFINYGFGETRDALNRVNVLKTVDGLSRTIDVSINWMFERGLAAIGVRENTTLGNVIKLLRLSENTVCYNITIDSPYRVRPRVVRLPGQPYIISNITRQHYAILDVLHRALDIGKTYAKAGHITIKASDLAYTYVSRGLYNACSSFAAYFHCIYAPVYLKAAKMPILTLSDDESQVPYDGFLSYWDEIKTIDPTFSMSTPHKRPFPITLQGINDVIFGTRLSGMMRTAFLTMWIPISETKGMSVNIKSAIELDYVKYAFLYVNEQLPAILDFYVRQLMRRQAIGEIERLVGKLLVGDIGIDNNLRLALQGSGFLLEATSSTFANVRNMLSEEIYNGAAGLDFSRATNILSDPRIYASVVGNLSHTGNTPIFHVGLNCVRSFVVDNFITIVDASYGANGIRPVHTGITISRVPITGGIDFRQTHYVPSIRLKIAESESMVGLNSRNYMTGYRYELTYRGRVLRGYASSPDEIKARIPEFNIITQNPPTYIEIEPKIMISQVVEFIRRCVNDKLAMLKVNKILMTSYFDVLSSIEADRTSEITSREMAGYFESNPFKVIPVKQLRTNHEVMSRVAQTITVPELPMIPVVAKCLYQNLHTPAIGQINSNFCPIVLPVVSGSDYQYVASAHGPQRMDQVAPCSLQIAAKIHYIRTRTAIYVSTSYA